MSQSLRKIKTLTSHSGHARFLAECGRTVGVVSSEKLPRTPYAFSQTKTVVDWNGRAVTVLETSHRHFEVWQIPADLVIAPSVPRGWCTCPTDQIAAGNAVYFSNANGHGWNCTVCGLLLQEG